MKAFFKKILQIFLSRLNGGFSIIETIVAVAIMALAIVGPMAAAYRSLVAAQSAKDMVKAVYLANEAAEYIKLVRDRNTINGRYWLNSLDDCEDDARGCGVDPTRSRVSDQVVFCQPTTVCDLYFESGTGFYTLRHSGSGVTPTIFNRAVFLIQPNRSAPEDVDERELRVVITWKSGPLRQRSYVLKTFINNWTEPPADKFNM